MTESNAKQGYYWTKDWQEGEREADKDIETKDWDTFLSAKEAINYLHKHPSKIKQE